MRRSRGVTVIEILVALSIVATLGVLAGFAYSGVRETLSERQCRLRLWEVGLALERYREEHRGQDPTHLAALVPDYLRPDQLECPLVQQRAPAAVAEARALMAPTPFKHWSSYFYFNRVALDRLRMQGHSPIGYSDVLRQRGDSTPSVVCFDHREPDSLRKKGLVTVETLMHWYHPEKPQIVLRRNGRVDASRYGGLFRDGQFTDTLAYLLHL